jgi:hypothetical protein
MKSYLFFACLFSALGGFVILFTCLFGGYGLMFSASIGATLLSGTADEDEDPNE